MVVWQRDPRVLWRRSGPRTVMSCPDREEAIVLNGTASLTWTLLSEPMEEQDLISALAYAFAVDPAVVGAEIVPFLDELLEAGAVRRS